MSYSLHSLKGFTYTPIMENQTEKEMANEMETAMYRAI